MRSESSVVSISWILSSAVTGLTSLPFEAGVAHDDTPPPGVLTYLESEKPNLVGGDVGGGSNALDQQLLFRRVTGWFRYATPVKSLYLCSASPHPGGGVHGMVGRNCARRVLADARLGRLGRLPR